MAFDPNAHSREGGNPERPSTANPDSPKRRPPIWDSTHSHMLGYEGVLGAIESSRSVKAS